MITAMANGIRIIHPVASVEEALALKNNLPYAILGGERCGEKIPGFDFGNSPFEYRPELVSNKALIFLTTNGTKTILAAQRAKKIYLGSFLNAKYIASKILGEKSIILACAGTKGDYSLEDTCGAGYLIHLLENMNKPELSDSARAAFLIYQACQEDLPRFLVQSFNGGILKQKGRLSEVEYCCTKDIIPLMPQFSPSEGIYPSPF